MQLPSFPYHPGPLLSGSIVAAENVCACCGERRGYVYTGPVYAEAEGLDDALCPWCIADGSASERFEATFVDEAAIEGELPEEVVQAVSRRTPGFNAWQQERWFACCEDAMAFVEPFGAAELQGKYMRLQGEAMTLIVHELGISGGAATRFMNSLDRAKGPTAYLFACRHCDTKRIYIDSL